MCARAVKEFTENAVDLRLLHIRPRSVNLLESGMTVDRDAVRAISYKFT